MSRTIMGEAPLPVQSANAEKALQNPLLQATSVSAYFHIWAFYADFSKFPKLEKSQVRGGVNLKKTCDERN